MNLNVSPEIGDQENNEKDAAHSASTWLHTDPTAGWVRAKALTSFTRCHQFTSLSAEKAVISKKIFNASLPLMSLIQTVPDFGGNLAFFFLDIEARQ